MYHKRSQKVILPDRSKDKYDIKKSKHVYWYKAYRILTWQSYVRLGMEVKSTENVAIVLKNEGKAQSTIFADFRQGIKF